MKKVYFWLPQGRLGNLIFQHQAIRHLSGDGWVVALASEYFDLFERSPGFFVLPCPKHFRRYVGRLWGIILNWCGRSNLFGTVQPACQTLFERFPVETEEITYKIGKLSGIELVRGFFQSPRYMHPLPRLKQIYVDAAERRLAAIPKESRVAIHLRFGDYVHWPVFGVPGAARLPAEYYFSAMKLIEKNVNTPHYVLLSDDPDKALALLTSDGKFKHFDVIYGGSVGKDFAIMASCSHAIMSASTFSWWAATLIQNSGRMLIAPQFWAGFRRGVWFPSNIWSSQFSYVSTGDTLPSENAYDPGGQEKPQDIV